MTRANLEAALAGEAMAALRYRLFEDQADAEGFEDVEELLEAVETEERRDHAAEIAEQLGLVRSTRENLAAALEGEVTEHRRLYPLFAAQARRVGDLEVAELFQELGADEHVHADQIRAALARLTLAPR